MYDVNQISKVLKIINLFFKDNELRKIEWKLKNKHSKASSWNQENARLKYKNSL